MSIRLSPEEAWDVVEGSHTAILTTLRADGAPIALPTWFVVEDETICIMTFTGTKKLSRIARDNRASFLVESGERWAELRAVHLNGVLEPIEEEAARARVDAALNTKYGPYRTARDELPEQAREMYAAKRFFRFVQEPRILSWDNSRLELKRS